MRDFRKIFPVLLFSCRRGLRTRRPCLRLRSLLFSCFRAGAGLERIGSAASCSPVFVPARAPNASAPPAAVPRTDGRGRTRTGERTGTAHVDLRQVGLRLGTVRSEVAASAPGPRKLGSAPVPGVRERGLSPSNSGRISLRNGPKRSRTSRFGGECQTPSAGAFGRTQRDGGHAECAEEILKCVRGRSVPHARAKRLAPARSAPSARARRLCAAPQAPGPAHMGCAPAPGARGQVGKLRTGGMGGLRAQCRKQENGRRQGLRAPGRETGEQEA